MSNSEPKAMYKKLHTEFQRIFFEHDLVGINFGSNTDEYDPEIETILPRMKEVKNSNDLSLVIQEEFSKWFGVEESKEISKTAYQKLSNELWSTWQNQQ